MGQAIGIPLAKTEPTRAVAGWLLVCAVMIFIMVILGGLTRLTDSGLSMMDWKPLSVLPPMSEAEWMFWFEKYKTIPQYQNLFPDMTLSGFKSIFWLEYFHRVFGRLIGVVFFIPFLWFLFRGHIGWDLGRKLAGIFVLGGLQGAMGWYMVASGFSTQIAVSHYRLAAHLMFAVVIYGAVLWVAFGLLWPRVSARGSGAASLRRWHMRLLALACVTIVSGAFVAGLRAGMIYNTFPFMGDGLLPPDLLYEQPWWRNFIENMATVQFTHRVLAVTLFCLVMAVWAWGRRVDLPARARLAVSLVPVAATLQLVLGISTLLLVVPVPLAAAHQGGALVLFSALVWAMHELRGRD